jgi:hypothetical protein
VQEGEGQPGGEQAQAQAQTGSYRRQGSWLVLY